ncbi:S-adenosyl-L-methionine-dependent methyltransferase [Rhypophila decipiens]|uniref:S-adenosyl-L-methionine-dependent methyltransferase n=1 Tax=Rhypophila decipiens TaxID=261697 RepID=A0AAN6Y4I2_9PEZI|nr:S-adenosyl-L-methionine-dependent methyltransferase [Rhypophila decipiens]
MGDHKGKEAAADPQTPPTPTKTIGTVETTGNASATSANDTSTQAPRSPPSTLYVQNDVRHDDEANTAQRQHEDEDPYGAPSVADSSGGSTGIEADIFDEDDDAYAESTSTSYLTSIASDIRRGIEENGRLYAAYGMHKTWLPIDDAELDRNDLQHCKLLLLLENKLFIAPIGDNPQNILDMGTGSGIWAMDVADTYPSAAVVGVDLAPTQPSMIPPNVHFEIDDIEKDWLYPRNHFDFIHGRELIMAIRDWPRLVRQAYNHLKPGGYLQLCGSYPAFQSDDGTLPDDSAYIAMGQIFFDMSERVGASGREPRNWKRYLEDAGYEDVVERVYKVPTNPWPKDPRLKRVGAFELEHFREGIANVFARGYTEILGGDPVYFQVLLAKARQEVSNRSMHSWVPFYYVYGRKPLHAS